MLCAIVRCIFFFSFFVGLAISRCLVCIVFIVFHQKMHVYLINIFKWAIPGLFLFIFVFTIERILNNAL